MRNGWVIQKTFYLCAAVIVKFACFCDAYSSSYYHGSIKNGCISKISFLAMSSKFSKEPWLWEKCWNGYMNLYEIGLYWERRVKIDSVGRMWAWLYRSREMARNRMPFVVDSSSPVPQPWHSVPGQTPWVCGNPCRYAGHQLRLSLRRAPPAQWILESSGYKRCCSCLLPVHTMSMGWCHRTTSIEWMHPAWRGRLRPPVAKSGCSGVPEYLEEPSGSRRTRSYRWSSQRYSKESPVSPFWRCPHCCQWGTDENRSAK